jgi:hypothetical protein
MAIYLGEEYLSRTHQESVIKQQLRLMTCDGKAGEAFLVKHFNVMLCLSCTERLLRNSSPTIIALHNSFQIPLVLLAERKLECK